MLSTSISQDDIIPEANKIKMTKRKPFALAIIKILYILFLIYVYALFKRNVQSQVVDLNVRMECSSLITSYSIKPFDFINSQEVVTVQIYLYMGQFYL